MATKGELAQRILRLIGVNTRFSEADPEEVQDVITYMEDWLASENGLGGQLGYNFASDDYDPTDDSGLPDWAVKGVTASVAIYVCPYFDKPIHPGIQRNARTGMQTIKANTTAVKTVQRPNTFPYGSGNNRLYSNKFYRKEDRIQTEADFLEDDGEDIITSDVYTNCEDRS